VPQEEALSLVGELGGEAVQEGPQVGTDLLWCKRGQICEKKLKQQKRKKKGNAKSTLLKYV